MQQRVKTHALNFMQTHAPTASPTPCLEICLFTLKKVISALSAHRETLEKFLCATKG